MIRHYKLHARASADGQVVTGGTHGEPCCAASEEDFYKLALRLIAGSGLMAQSRPIWPR